MCWSVLVSVASKIRPRVSAPQDLVRLVVHLLCSAAVSAPPPSSSSSPIGYPTFNHHHHPRQTSTCCHGDLLHPRICPWDHQTFTWFCNILWNPPHVHSCLWLPFCIVHLLTSILSLPNIIVHLVWPFWVSPAARNPGVSSSLKWSRWAKLTYPFWLSGRVATFICVCVPVGGSLQPRTAVMSPVNNTAVNNMIGWTKDLLASSVL